MSLRHTREFTLEEKKYFCKNCEKYFSHLGNLKNHENIHLGETLVKHEEKALKNIT